MMTFATVATPLPDSPAQIIAIALACSLASVAAGIAAAMCLWRAAHRLCRRL